MTLRSYKYGLIILACMGLITSCNKKKNLSKEVDSEPPRVVNVPKFNSDSAYFFIKKQVEFGPRVPNSESHEKTGNYLALTLKKYGATIVEQHFESDNYEGKKLHLKNIIASFNPGKQKRILLASHWDTRPFADKDKENSNAQFDGANDGASGVGVLLEMARNMRVTLPNVGIDIILFDGEDWGEREMETGTHPLPKNLQDWWCLGSQYWAKNKHANNYSAYYGILLDMVGAENAKFFREEKSLTYGPTIVEKVWNAGSTLGHSRYFIKQNMGSITDDHCFVSEIGKIPMIDIIHFDPHRGSFGDFHHSRKDALQIISKETLHVVGETMMYVVYHEE